MQAWSWWTSCYDRTMRAFKRDDIRWLNLLLASGLVSINLVAFGAAYWLATRDIMTEFTGEVRIGSNGSLRARGVRDVEATRSYKWSSLSKKGDPVAAEEESNVSLPLPPPRLNTSKPSVTTATPTAARAPRRLAEAPMASPNTAPLPEQESQEEPRPVRDASAGVETGPRAESP
jgi:hypothetical protein